MVYLLIPLVQLAVFAKEHMNIILLEPELETHIRLLLQLSYPC